MVESTSERDADVEDDEAQYKLALNLHRISESDVERGVRM